MSEKSKKLIGNRLFDEVKRLKAENDRLKINVKNALQYTHDEVMNGNLSVKVSDSIRDILTDK